MSKLSISLLILFSLLLPFSSPWCYRNTITQTASVDDIDLSLDNSSMVTVDGTNKIVTIWNYINGAKIATYVNSTAIPIAARYSKDGALLGIGYSDGSVHVLTVSGTTYTFLRSISSGYSSVSQIDWSWSAANNILICGDKSFVVFTTSGTATSFNNALGTGTPNKTMGCKLSKNSDVAVTTQSGKLRYYAANSTSHTFELSNGIYGKLDFIPRLTDTRFLAPSENNNGYMQVVGATPVESTIITLTTKILTSCYSKDGNYFTMGGQGNISYIFNGTGNNNTLLQSFRDSVNFISACRFSYDNKYLAVGDKSGNIYIYTSECLNCIQGTYFSAGDCLTCSTINGCFTCSSATVCSQCFEGYFLNGSICSGCGTMTACKSCFNSSICYECNVGYYLDTTNKSCYTCDSFNTGCAQCYLNQSTGSTICKKCNVQYYLSASNLCTLCISSIPQCLRCFTSTSCMQCQFGYFISGTTCSACPSRCLICLNNSYCTTCMKGFYTNSSAPSNNLCVSCSSNCLSCYNTGTCISCVESYYIAANGTCLICPSTCLTCNSSSICLTCPLSYYLSSTTCVQCISYCSTCSNSTNCLTCFIGYYLNVSNNCSACQTTYNQCSSCNSTHCLSCQVGYYLSSTSTCLLCNITNGCMACDNSTKCVSCLPNYYLNGNTCSSCSYNCQSCLNSTYCYTCSLGYSLNSSFACISCLVGCSICQSTTNCTSCIIGYYLDTTTTTYTCLKCSQTISGCLTCLTNSTCSSCQVGKYLSSATNCTICSSFCISCNSTACFSCEIGYYLSNGTCQKCSVNCTSCTSNSICTSCNIGYYFNSTLSTNQCSSCSLRGCQTCNQSTCYNCQISYFLNSTICSKCNAAIQNCVNCLNSTVCLECAYGYYQLSLTACSLCSIIQGCQNCYNASSCSECVKGYNLLVNGTCSYCPVKCSSCNTATCQTCSPKYTFNLGLNDCLLCSSFIQGCQYCDSNTICTNCLAGYYLLPNSTCKYCQSIMTGCSVCQNSTTCNSCYEAYYLNSTTKICDSCQIIPGCQLCNSSTVCLSCQNNYYLSSNTCLLCSQILTGCLYCANVTYCKMCQTSYYLDATLGVCVLCKNVPALIGCIHCESNSVCVNCAGGYYLNTSSKTCFGCQLLGCSICSQNSNTVCISCSFGYYLASNQCQSCNSSFGCLDCTTGSNCTLCSTGYYLESNATCSSCSNSEACTKCINSTICLQCKSLFYLNNSTKQCSICASILPQCQNCLNATVCQSCISGFYVDSSFNCQPCTSITGCFMCSSSTQCISCSVGYYLSVNNCIPCSTAINNCFSCQNTTSCVSCQSGYTLNPNSQCDAIKISSTAPDPIPELKVKTTLVNSTALKHTLLVNEKYRFKQVSLNWSKEATISLYYSKNNSQIILSVVSASWGQDGLSLYLYTNNPISINISALSMPLARLLISAGDFELNYKTKFSLTKSALNQILPNLIITNSFISDEPLMNPAFYMSLIETVSSQYYFDIFAYVFVGLLALIFFCKSCVSPQSDNQGEIIGHILSLKTCAIMMFPIFPQMINFCKGFMIADFPWLNNYYANKLSVESDQSPVGYQLFYTNINFASLYLTALLVMLTFVILGYISITKNEKPSKQSKDKSNKLDLPISTGSAFIKFILNFFYFGLVFAGASSLQGSIYNYKQTLTINGSFYILGVLVYVCSLVKVIQQLQQEKKNTNLLRLYLKASLLSIAHISPLYITTLAALFDISIAIATFKFLKGNQKHSNIWLFNHITINICLISLYYFNTYKIIIYAVIAVISLIIVLQIFIAFQQSSNIQKTNSNESNIKNSKEQLKKTFEIENITQNQFGFDDFEYKKTGFDFNIEQSQSKNNLKGRKKRDEDPLLTVQHFFRDTNKNSKRQGKRNRRFNSRIQDNFYQISNTDLKEIDSKVILD